MFDIRRWFAAPPFRRPEQDEFDRAAALIDVGRPADAIVALDDAAVAEAPPDRRAFAYNKRGVALVLMGRREEALGAFCEALMVQEAYAPALVNIGNLLLEEGDLTDAIEHYRAAIVADESYPSAYSNLAAALRRAGRASEAARYLKKALQLEVRRRS